MIIGGLLGGMGGGLSAISIVVIFGMEMVLFMNHLQLRMSFLV